MASIIVRQAERPDVPALVELADALIAEDAGGRNDSAVDLQWASRHGTQEYTALVDHPDKVALLAESDGYAVGSLTGGLLPPNSFEPVSIARLGSLYVRPDHRGEQVGSQLVRQFLAWVREHGGAYVQVSAYATNDGAIRFYQRHGLTPYLMILRGELSEPGP